MELHRNVFDSVPILLTLATFFTVFYKLRMRWPMKVNCWFCNENTKIWRQHLDWWLCPWCEQYNGFSKNGDYAYDIPEQYATSKMHTRYCKLSEKSNNVFNNKLCTYCNKRERLKLLELSSFEPKNEKFFDKELKAFKDYLEMRYPLCENCKFTVQNVLRKQAVWLTYYKMLFFKRKPIQMFVSNARKSETIFRAVSISLVSIIIYNHDFVWLPIVGLFFHLCTCWTNSMKNKTCDTLLIFLWFCIIILVFIKSFETFQNTWLTTEHIVQYHLILGCAFVTALISLRSSMYKNTSTNSVAFKKIKLCSSQLAYDQSGNNIVSTDVINNIESSNYSDTTDKSSFTEMKFNDSHSAILRQKLSTITTNNKSDHSISQNENSSPDCCLNNSLSTLLLSDDLPKYKTAKMTPAMFERRVYSATGSESLFKKSNSTYGKRKCILSPPKLRSVTQTSWVAGGYWQEGMVTAMPATLSRSSSQSSGFGSIGSSNLASSREPSVHEFDRCSVMSEATRWSCQTPWPGSATKHDSSIPYPQSRYFDATGNHSRATYSTDDQAQEKCKSNVVKQNDSTPTYHTTTIVANSGWLSALLCGSLILNMIVLCTTLLR